jgi:hydrogenase maturation protease
MSDGALVIGWGNVLRRDDGLGWHAAERLARDPRLARATVLQRHQLTPELALDISRASFVVFVDASRGPAASLAVVRVTPAAVAAIPWSHHVDPAILLALARDLYGHAPEAVVVSVGVASVAMGRRLSHVLQRVLPEVVDAVVRLVAEHDRPGAAIGARTGMPDGAAALVGGPQRWGESGDA